MRQPRAFGGTVSGAACESPPCAVPAGRGRDCSVRLASSSERPPTATAGFHATEPCAGDQADRPARCCFRGRGQLRRASADVRLGRGLGAEPLVRDGPFAKAKQASKEAGRAHSLVVLSGRVGPPTGDARCSREAEAARSGRGSKASRHAAERPPTRSGAAGPRRFMLAECSSSGLSTSSWRGRGVG